MLPVTPRQMWLAVVITTGISYLGYVLHTYLLPRKGLLLTGIVGGLYSSRATVLVLARKSNESAADAAEASQAILLAVSMMYLRLLALVAIFRFLSAGAVAPALLGLALAAAVYSAWLQQGSRNRAVKVPAEPAVLQSDDSLQRNPLELNAAFVFAVLQGDFPIADRQIQQAIIIASASNNLLKAAYVFALGSRQTARMVAPGLVGLALLSLLYVALGG